PGLREVDSEINRITDTIAALDYFVAEKANAYDIVIPDAFTYCLIDFEWQPHTIFAWSAVTIIPSVESAQKSCHRVGVRVVQLDAVKSTFLCALRRVSKDLGQHQLQLPPVCRMPI